MVWYGMGSEAGQMLTICSAKTLRDKVSGVSDRQRKTRRSFEVEVRHGRSAMRCLVAMKPDGGGNEKEMGMKTDVDL